jgi:hypothetical protein
VQSYVVKTAAWLEIVAGAILVIVPDIACSLLFSTTLDSSTWPLARWVGVALLSLGIGCLPSKTTALHRHAVLALFVYNAGVAVLFAWVGTTTVRHGPLWPAAILHFLISLALLLQLLFPRVFGRDNSRSEASS